MDMYAEPFSGTAVSSTRTRKHRLPFRDSDTPPHYVYTTVIPFITLIGSTYININSCIVWSILNCKSACTTTITAATAVHAKMAVYFFLHDEKRRVCLLLYTYRHIPRRRVSSYLVRTQSYPIVKVYVPGVSQDCLSF